MVDAGRLRAALAPQRLVFVGGRNLEPTLRYLEVQGFSGDAIVVNPHRNAVAGLHAVPSVADVPFPIDLAFVAVSRNRVTPVVRDLSGAGCGLAIVYAGGYAELGADGARAQAELVEAAGSMAMLGPNAPGLVNHLDGVSAFMDNIGTRRVERGVAILSQSGGVLCDLSFADRSLDLALLIGTGNQAQIGIAELIEALLDEPRIGAIGLVLEGLREVAPLARASALASRRGIPLVALKGGRTEAGARASQTHTAALVGEAELWSAFFKRQNIICVHTLAEMIETLKLADVARGLSGSRVFVGSGSGFQGILAADQLAAAGFDLKPPSPAASEAAKRHLPSIAAASNPLDVTMAAWGKGDVETAIFRALLQDPYDVALLLTNYPPTGTWDTADFDRNVEAFIAAATGKGRPPAGPLAAILSTFPEGLPATMRAQALAAGIVPLQGFEEGLRALAHLRTWTDTRSSPGDDERESLFTGPLPAGPATELAEMETKAALARAGFGVPPSVVIDVTELHPKDLDLSARISGLAFPLVLKLDRPGLVHKSEAGAVQLGIETADALVAAAAAMLERAGKQGRDPGPCRLLVEEMVAGQVLELLIAFRRDAQMGWVLTLGRGGTGAELAPEVRVLLLPAGRDTLERALASLTIDRLLRGYRGDPGYDREALFDLVLGLLILILDWPGLLELELNPVLIGRPGEGATIVDATARVAAPG